jgi:hypothetical protein
MDILDDELVRFWRTLNENDVRYIMVGGFAIRFHGFNRSTDDLDMWLEDTIGNRKNLRKAFSELGYGDFASLETMQFVPGWTNFYIGGGIELDIIKKLLIDLKTRLMLLSLKRFERSEKRVIGEQRDIAPLLLDISVPLATF